MVDSVTRLKTEQNITKILLENSTLKSEGKNFSVTRWISSALEDQLVVLPCTGHLRVGVSLSPGKQLTIA